MKFITMMRFFLVSILLLVLLSGHTTASDTKTWTLINPEGMVSIKPLKVNPHQFFSLEGKTVALRWNGKQNGDHVLNKIAEMLIAKVPSVKIIKLYELEPSMNRTSGPPGGKPEDSEKFAKKIASYKPDIVIASQAD